MTQYWTDANSGIYETQRAGRNAVERGHEWRENKM